MKRSIDASSDSTKKAKSSNDDVVQAQPELMPRIPAIPPEAPLSEAAKADLQRKYRFKYQKIPAKVYGSEDKKLWPEIASSVFKTQVDIHNNVHASHYIRGWFLEHDGLRAPPPKPPRSAYSVYYNEQKTLWCRTHGKWNQKRDSKKIGAMWKGLTEDVQQVYHTKRDNSVAQFKANDTFWKEEAEKWGLEKAKKHSGEDCDPEKLARNYGMSADQFYFYKWW